MQLVTKHPLSSTAFTLNVHNDARFQDLLQYYLLHDTSLTDYSSPSSPTPLTSISTPSLGIYQALSCIVNNVCSFCVTIQVVHREGGTTLGAEHIAGIETMYQKQAQICLKLTRARLLGWEDALEKEMATHSSIFAWRIAWTVACQAPLSMRSQELDATQRLNHQS